MTIPALVSAAAEQFGDAPAIVDGDTTYSFVQLHEAARRFAAAIIDTGAEAGDRVAIWAPNGAEWIISFLGLSAAGAALVPVNTRYKGVEASDILARSHARALVTVTDFLGTDYVGELRSSAAPLPDLHTVIVADGPIPDDATSWTEFVGSVTESDLARADARAKEVSDTDVADIMFTSGTTGVPKGVVQTHRSTLQVAADWVAMTGLTAGDRYLMINPYFHMFGLKAGILACMTAGATMYPVPVFAVDRALQQISDERITVLPGPPTLYQSILDHPARAQHDLSSLRIAVTGAADVPVQLIRRLADELSVPTIVVGYGLTEGGTATGTSPTDDADTIATTVGRPRPGFELRIVDRDGSEVTAGEAGEILLRSDTVMSHYLDDATATAQALSPDGWLRTGDLGLLDPAGNLRIVGRSKDMFIVGGFNAYPAEIENALLRHPDVQQAAVIGVPDDRLGEVGMAFVVLRSGSETSAADVMSWSRREMANFKVPRRVEILDEMPLNATGKIMKDELRRRTSV